MIVICRQLGECRIKGSKSCRMFPPMSLPPSSMFPSGVKERNVVMWMDHRATEQASRITATSHRVLSAVGGVMSPEMQPPKLLWLKEVTQLASRFSP